MIKYLVYIFLAVMMLPSCKRDLDSSVFDKSADQRLNSVLANYQSLLVAAPYGWMAKVVPNPEESDGVYAFWFKFNDSNRVVSRWKDQPALNSSYRLKALQQPELIFDTYTYLHLLADAEAKVPGAKPGLGLQSDFELEIISASADSIVLKGKYNGSDVIMSRATAKDTSGNIVLPGYPLAGSYKDTSARTLYKTTQADGAISTVAKFTGVKEATPLKYAGTVSVDYSDLGSSGWQYNIAVKNPADKEITVTINTTMQQGIKEGSFKVLDKSYDPVSGRIYLKTFYTNAAGADRVTEEVLSR
jgi:Domain of unknown function (DUF4302)